MANEPAHFRPASWYFRQAVRGEEDLAQLREIALCLIEEIELLKKQVHGYGEIPHRRYDVHAWLGHFEDERPGGKSSLTWLLQYIIPIRFRA